uniref:Glutamate--cysteine ligase n=2 Tax=Spongospora subterranea TaxID=70186 RepID=A0A0H5R609_9EUKA|eukprot:CRZ09212.1 hypothetical protein [Spongospora subterranea]
MGLLSLGTPLAWKDSQPYIEHVKRQGIDQFISTYNRLSSRKRDEFLWGDEVEYLLVSLDSQNKTAKLLMKGVEVLHQLENLSESVANKAVFHPEYGRFMIETTPGGPYRGFTSDLSFVEANMIYRRHLIQSVLDCDNYRLLSMASFPLLGTDKHCDPDLPIGGPITRSSYVPDSVMNPHPRFPCLTANIRERRSDKVCITIPRFKDKYTPKPKSEPKVNIWGDLMEDTAEFIHMDAMAFGMGCCCLQVTFQCGSIEEARHLYDQLAVLSPIMLALTAASPFFKGCIADTDVRWNVISQSVDDRTPYERGLTDKDDGFSQLRLSKSRYSSVDMFLGTRISEVDSFNDVPVVFHQKHLDQLQNAGIDSLLARHVAHLFARDPLVIFSERINIDDETETDHFESIQSTNWNTVRFKPPPPQSTTGWRVEFRTMEVQITDFENAAFTVFVAVLSRAILFFNLNFYMPISLVDVNVQRAHTRDAVNVENFHMRIRPKPECTPCPSQCHPSDYKEMSMEEIMCGKADCCGFAGLLSFVEGYLDAIHCDSKSRALIDEYMNFIEMRAKSQFATLATWMRRFVQTHPDYRFDSNISQSTAFDLINVLDEIAAGRVHCPQLLPELGKAHRNVLDTSVEAALAPNPLGVPLTIDFDANAVHSESVCKIIERAASRRRANSSGTQG